MNIFFPFVIPLTTSTCQGLIPDKSPIEAPRRNPSSTEDLHITVEVALKEYPMDADHASLSTLVTSAALPDEEEDDKVTDLGVCINTMFTLSFHVNNEMHDRKYHLLNIWRIYRFTDVKGY